MAPMRGFHPPGPTGSARDHSGVRVVGYLIAAAVDGTVGERLAQNVRNFGVNLCLLGGSDRPGVAWEFLST